MASMKVSVEGSKGRARAQQQRLLLLYAVGHGLSSSTCSCCTRWCSVHLRQRMDSAAPAPKYRAAGSRLAPGAGSLRQRRKTGFARH